MMYESRTIFIMGLSLVKIKDHEPEMMEEISEQDEVAGMKIQAIWSMRFVGF